MVIWEFSLKYIIITINYYQMQFWHQPIHLSGSCVCVLHNQREREKKREKEIERFVTDQPLAYDLIPHHIKINSQ